MASHPLATAVPRVPACSPAVFRERWVRAAEPVVVGGVAASWPASSRWTLPALRARLADAPVTVMRAPGGRVDYMGPGGTTYAPSTLGGYLDALAAGAADPGYLVTKWSDLPEGLRGDVPRPELAGDPRWTRSALWL